MELPKRRPCSGKIGLDKTIHVGVLNSNCAGSWYVSTLLSIARPRIAQPDMPLRTQVTSNRYALHLRLKELYRAASVCRCRCYRAIAWEIVSEGWILNGTVEVEIRL